MSKDNTWEVENKTVTSGSALAHGVTGGISPPDYDYTVKNTETGETRHVTAYNDDHLSDQISKGNFSDKK